MQRDCLWLFGRGASIANGLSWAVPIECIDDLIEGRISREEHQSLIIETVRQEMQNSSVHCRPYRRLLNFMANRTVGGGSHRLVTTNWDYLLQLEVEAWIAVNKPGYAPWFLSTHSSVLHLNGTAEPGASPYRSPFLLETDAADYRTNTIEANKAFNDLLWSTLVVIIGMSFECDIDKGLLASLHAHEDNMPIGEALFLVVDPFKGTLDNIARKISRYFPRANVQLVNSGLEEWVDTGMPELVGRIFDQP